MKKHFITEAVRMQKLAGIAEAKVVPPDNRIYTLTIYNVEYDNGDIGYLYQLSDDEEEEVIYEDWWDDVYFLGFGDDDDPQVFPDEDFEDTELGGYTEQKMSKREAAELYKKLTGKK